MSLIAVYLIEKIVLKSILANPKINKGKELKSRGLPIIRIGRNGKLIIGDRFVMNNGLRANLIGRNQRCILNIWSDAVLEIGNNVGMSSTAIVVKTRIKICDNVRIGGNVVIYDTDFHPVNPDARLARIRSETKAAPIIIGESVFLGAHSIVLKGVTIGANSVIGAGSVVTKDVPANQVWAGNPAKFIRELDRDTSFPNSLSS